MVARNTIKEYLLLGLHSQLPYEIGHILLVLLGSAGVIDIAEMQNHVDSFTDHHVLEQFIAVFQTCAVVSNYAYLVLLAELSLDDSEVPFMIVHVCEFQATFQHVCQISLLKRCDEIYVIVGILFADFGLFQRLQILF